MSRDFKMVAKTFVGLEDILADELIAIGAKEVKKGIRQVSFTGNTETLYTANHVLRTAIRILKPIYTTTIHSQDEYYDAIKQIPWDRYMNYHQTLLVDSVINSDLFSNTHFAALRAKDAVCDCFREKYRQRPIVEKNTPDIVVNVHLAKDKLTISLDSTGSPLFKRGYRKKTMEAPINEVLAAGILVKLGYKGNNTFVDPMCGSGTFAIEAALIATKIPPGAFRNDYCFKRWRGYDKNLYENVVRQYDKFEKPNFKIIAADIDPQAIEVSRLNARQAGVESCIQFLVNDFAQNKIDYSAPAIMAMNPPYGERIGKEQDLNQLYSAIGTMLKNNCPATTVGMVSSNKKAINYIGLKAASKEKLFNGALECDFNTYTIFEGKYKDFKQNES